MHNPQDSSKRQVSFKKGDMVVRIPEYFEFKEGNSSKFWEINHLTLTSFTTCWGKIGSKGRISTKECTSSWEASSKYWAIRANKKANGYKAIERPRERQKLDDQTKYYLVIEVNGLDLVRLLCQDSSIITNRNRSNYQVINKE